MLRIYPSINRPIIILDSDSGTEWSFIQFYDKRGDVVLGFDAPPSVKITNQRHSGAKRNAD